MSENIRRPRVLVLTPRYPYPVIGGDRLRIYQVCKALSATCDLTLLSLCESREELDAALPEDGVFCEVERVLLPRWRSLLNTLMALAGRQPLQLAYYHSRDFARRLQVRLRQHDLVLAHLIRTGEYVRHSDVPVVLEMTDAISLNYQRVKALKRKRHWKSWVYSIEASRLLAYERAVVRDFAATTLVSDVDRQFLLRGQVDDRVMVCSNGVDTQQLYYRARREAGPVIAFIGNMTTLQNLDACLYFATEVLPRLRQRGPFIFRVVGRIDDRTAQRLEEHDGLELRRNIPDVAKEVEDAYAAVAPMRLGAGVQNKVLEYMALGLPVVTTTVGLEGLRAKPGEAIELADTPDAFVQHLTRLWRAPTERETMGRAGRTYVEQFHSWQYHLAPLVRRVEELTFPVMRGDAAPAPSALRSSR